MKINQSSSSSSSSSSSKPSPSSSKTLSECLDLLNFRVIHLKYALWKAFKGPLGRLGGSFMVRDEIPYLLKWIWTFLGFLWDIFSLIVLGMVLWNLLVNLPGVMSYGW